MSSSKRPPPAAIDRTIPGVGRLTIRAGRLTREARDALDQHIVHATQAGRLEQLRLLKSREVSPLEFLEASRQNRLLALRPATPLRPLVSRWLAVSDIRESSRERYEQSWRFLYDTLPENSTLKDLTKEWWATFVEERHEEVGNATINRDRAAFLAFRNWAGDNGYAVVEFKSKRLTEEPAKSELLTPDRIEAMRDKCRPDRWLFFRAALETGARQGELLNAYAREISQVPPLWTVPSRPGSKSRGKSRSLPISRELAASMLERGTRRPDGRVFPHSRHTIRDWWDELTEQIGVTGVTLHGLRATYITAALDAGVPPVQVQKLAGHAHLTTTMGYYRSDAVSRSAAEAVARALGLDWAAQASAEGSSVRPSTASGIESA